MPTETDPTDCESLVTKARAALSEGRSHTAILDLVVRALRDRAPRYGIIVDLGCGAGTAARALAPLCDGYIGCDVVCYTGFPDLPSTSFCAVDLNHPPYAVPSESADAVVSIETIEHLENPRALLREMVRIVRRGGWVVVTTPNQLSLASKLHLLVKDQFLAFQEGPGLYPAHITALVEEDLRRIGSECGLCDVEIRYTGRGRIPLSAWHWPRFLANGRRAFSDNVVLLGRRP